MKQGCAGRARRDHEKVGAQAMGTTELGPETCLRGAMPGLEPEAQVAPSLGESWENVPGPRNRTVRREGLCPPIPRELK